MDTLKKLKIIFLTKEFRKIKFLTLGMLVTALFEVLGVASIAPFMALVSNPEMINENEYFRSIYLFFDFENQNQFVIATGAIVIITIVLSNTINASMLWFVTHFIRMQGHFLASRLIESYLKRDYEFFISRNSSDLSKNILSEVDRCMVGVVLPALTIVARVVASILMLIFLFYLDAFIAFIVLITLGGSYLLMYLLVKKKMYNMGVESTEVIFQKFKVANEVISGIKNIKLRGIEMEFLNAYKEPSKKSARYYALSDLISALPRYAIETIAFSGIIIMILSLMNNENYSGSTIPLISLYALAGYRLLPSLQAIYNSYAKIKYTLPAFDLLIKDLTSLDKKTEIKVKSHKTKIIGDISLNNIYYNYPESKSTIISGLDLEIKQYSCIGIIGGTGAGKTTFIDIILGLLKIKSGEMLVGGVKINASNIRDWQENIGYVPQSIYLMDNTIMHNIAYTIHKEDITMARVVEASKLANLDQFINTLPDGYMTMTGEKGIKLSGGQKQRIGIARALYNNPEVLILDEATSSLDGLTESFIVDSIHNKLKKKTIIMVAHRLSTLTNCDIIHLIKDGKMHDSGSLEELKARNKDLKKIST